MLEAVARAPGRDLPQSLVVGRAGRQAQPAPGDVSFDQPLCSNGRRPGVAGHTLSRGLFRHGRIGNSRFASERFVQLFQHGEQTRSSRLPAGSRARTRNGQTSLKRGSVQFTAERVEPDRLLVWLRQRGDQFGLPTGRLVPQTVAAFWCGIERERATRPQGGQHERQLLVSGRCSREPRFRPGDDRTFETAIGELCQEATRGTRVVLVRQIRSGEVRDGPGGFGLRNRRVRIQGCGEQREPDQSIAKDRGHSESVSLPWRCEIDRIRGRALSGSGTKLRSRCPPPISTPQMKKPATV